MSIDLRLPLGLLFIVLGVIMLVYGLTTNPGIYQRSLGINVNFWWGLVEVAFGSAAALFGYRSHRSGRV